MPTIIFTPQIFVVSTELVANDDFALTPANTPVNVPVLANDTLGDEPVQLSDLMGPPVITQPPAHGAAEPNPDGTVTYTPPAGFCGYARFEYEIEAEAPPPPEECVTFYNTAGGVLYVDDVVNPEPPDWWGVSRNIIVHLPSGDIAGSWNEGAGGYDGSWPGDCTFANGTIEWGDGVFTEACFNWWCPA